MAKMKSRAGSAVVLFDVFYEDGSRASNRKVPTSELGGVDGDASALSWIMHQERKISELSGKGPRPIKKIVRSQ